MTTFTDDQFQTLLATLAQGMKPVKAEETEARNDPAALGPMPACNLGTNKMMKLTIFEEWLEEAENRMNYIGSSDCRSKISLLKAWGGAELLEFIKANKIEAGSSYEDYTKAIKDEFRKLVNRTMAMHDLLTTKQGTKKWMDFIHELEKKAKILDMEKKPYTTQDVVKDAAIFGMTDPRLREKALAEDPTLQVLTQWGHAREAGKTDAYNLKDTATGAVKRIGWGDIPQEDMPPEEIDSLIESLKVMKLKKVGKYSSRVTKKNEKCNRCLTEHPQGRCPANGKECFTCGEKNHFSRSPSCKGKLVKRIMNEERKSYSDTRTTAEASKGNEAETTRKIATIRKIKKPPTSELWVTINVGGNNMDMYIDSGCDFTIIPPSHYTPTMGVITENDTNLRAWGAEDLLDVKGMIHTTLATQQGAKRETVVYIVDGFYPEPLLGAKDAEELGFIAINKEGRKPTEQEKSNRMRRVNQSLDIQKEEEDDDNTPVRKRNAVPVKITTHPGDTEMIPAAEREKVMKLVETYKSTVFDDRKIGKINTTPIHLEYDENFIPEQPRFRNVPIHYQPEVSKLLNFLREQGVITDVDPREAFECIMNVVITDKKGGDIRMNIDNTPRNPGMKRSKFHVQTPQEIRHELKEATVFSEMDMGWGYHQLPIDEESKKRAIFQTHEGVHRMERLYFGPTASSGIFHNEVRKALAGLPGVTSIHDNMLVWGRNCSDHYENIYRCLQRCLETGIALKLSKSSFCLNRIKWFGRIFTGNGVTADADKIEHIKEAGRPETTEDVRSLLMACQFNAKFYLNSCSDASYEEVTAPLRRLLKSDVPFKWGEREEEAFNTLLSVMNDPATLQAFRAERETHVVADSCEYGIQGSTYQVADATADSEEWVPVDHTSRTLTETEQRYSPLERESLAQKWSMEQFRFYLVGKEFTAWTDHEPLVAIYNNRQSPASKRVSTHRDTVQDLQYTMKYMEGRNMPCDYGSRHPQSISHLNPDEQEALGFDNGQEIYIRRMINFDKSPNAVNLSDIQAAAEKDDEITTVKENLINGTKPRNSSYLKVWDQLCVVNGILLKEDKIVIPDVDVEGTNLRRRIMDIAHEGHPGTETMKRYLRSRVWFPRLDIEVQDLTRHCLPCQAATVTTHRDPLVPSEPPDHVWKDLAADHWGPTPEGKYILGVIDKLSRFPEIMVVRGTDAESNIEALDNIFTRYGYCETLQTDGGPPFNGNEYHALQRYFRWAGIKHTVNMSAEDPEANGLAESLMKHLGKIWHTAYIEKKDPTAEVNRHLQMMRATPHPTTGKVPAEMMFSKREYRTRLLEYRKHEECEIVREAQEEDRRQKARQKIYKDNKCYVKPHTFTIGDTVLLSQKKTKMKPPYDPDPYTVTDVRGHQITAERGGKFFTRDAQKWKHYKATEQPDYSIRKETVTREEEEDDTGFGCEEMKSGTNQIEDPTSLSEAEANEGGEEIPNEEIHEEQGVIPARRNPQRNRQPPQRYR